jgi:CRISPR-associated exonuclease Cas4
VLTVTDLKQWGYCGRIVFYQHRFGVRAGRPTFKMTEGHEAQEMIEKLETRRTLREYGYEDAERRFNVWLASEQLGLNGKLDLLLVRADEAAVVDFKLTAGEPMPNHTLQLAGYSLLVEEELGLPVKRGFIFRIPDDRVYSIDLEAGPKEAARRGLMEMREMIESEVLPEATGQQKRCEECEYANYCGDVW